MSDNHIRLSVVSTASIRESAGRHDARSSIRAHLTSRLRAGGFDPARPVEVRAAARSALARQATRLTSVAQREAVARAQGRAVRATGGHPCDAFAAVPLHGAAAVTRRLRAPSPANDATVCSWSRFAVGSSQMVSIHVPFGT